MYPALPHAFIERITKTFGEEGERWLQALPSIVDVCSQKWSLTIQPETYELNYNFIASVRRKDGTNAILKIGYRLENEMETLRAFDGKHSVQLLDADPERGALLLERIDPGDTLENIQRQNDDDATRIGAEVIRSLVVPVPTTFFPHLRDWCSIFKSTLQSASDIPSDLLRQGMEMFDRLVAKKPKDFLLHGDLHHTNILFDTHRGWLAIDPKGVIGPKASM
jgi:streptomycin 6-kinase